MAKILTSLIFLAAYLLATGQAEAARCLDSAASVEITHAHGHGHHQDSHASEAPEGQEQPSHSHEIVIGGCACFVVPASSLRIFEATFSRSVPRTRDSSAPFTARLCSIFRPPIA